MQRDHLINRNKKPCEFQHGIQSFNPQKIFYCSCCTCIFEALQNQTILRSAQLRAQSNIVRHRPVCTGKNCDTGHWTLGDTRDFTEISAIQRNYKIRTRLETSNRTGQRHSALLYKYPTLFRMIKGDLYKCRMRILRSIQVGF